MLDCFALRNDEVTDVCLGRNRLSGIVRLMVKTLAP